MQHRPWSLTLPRRGLKATVTAVCVATVTGTCIMLTAPSSASENGAVTAPEQMAIIRVYGSILYSTKKWRGGDAQLAPLTARQIESWMKKCADAGVTTVLWRANCAGTLTFPSRFAPMPGEPPLPDPNEGMGVASVKQGWPLEDWQWLGEQCKRLNTLEAAVAAAHKHGLKLYLNFHTFDMVGSWTTPKTWPDGGDRGWDPDMWLWSKDQNSRLAGVPCYADPNVRNRRLDELAEALEYDLDGVVLGLFSHCDGLSGEQRCEFGYNPVIVEQYRRRYNVDPLTKDVDPHKFYALHGEGFTEFVRAAGRLVRNRGMTFICATRTDGVHGWGGAAAGKAIVGDTMQPGDRRDAGSELPLAAGFYLETEKWAEEGLVDGLLCHAPSTDGIAAVQQLREKVHLPAYLWRKFTGWEGTVSGGTLGDFQAEAQAIGAGALDGYCMLIMQIIDHPSFTPDWTAVLGR